MNVSCPCLDRKFARLASLALIFLPCLSAQLTITTGDQSLPLGRVEIPLQATGGAAGYAWSLDSCAIPGVVLRTDVPSSFPPGTAAGLIGVATQAISYPCTVRVTSGANTTTKTLNINIMNLVVTSNWELPDGSLGELYSQSITARGSGGLLTFTFQSGMLPPGLSLNSNGQVSGTPTGTGSYDFNYTVSESGNTLGRNARIYISKLKFTNAAPLNATQGASYSHTFAVSGATNPVSYSISCCMPGGLNFDPATGVLSGTPTGPAHWSFIVTATESGTGAMARKNFNLGVVGNPVTLLTINTATLDDWTIGDQQSWMIVGVNGGTPPYSWSLASGALPPGVTFLSPAAFPPNYVANGFLLSGTPTNVASYPFRLQVTDSGGQTTSRDLTLVVSPLASDGLPSGTYGSPYNQKLRPVGGLPGYTVTALQGALPTGVTMDSAGQLTGTPMETGNFNIQAQIQDSAIPRATLTRNVGLRVNSSTPSSVNIVQGAQLGNLLLNQPYTKSFSASGGSGLYNWTQIGGALPAGLFLSGVPGSGPVSLAGTPTATGDYTFTLRVEELGNPTNFSARTFRLKVTSLRLTSNSTLPWGNVSTSYSSAITADGNAGALSWSVQGGAAFLPPGLNLSAGGVLSGIPTAVGQYNFSLTATDSVTLMNATWGFNLAIYAQNASPPLSITTGDQNLWLGRSKIELRATGGTGVYTWSLDTCNMPPGFALRTDTLPAGWSAAIMGVATGSGTYACTVRATSGSSTATKAITIKIGNFVVTNAGDLPEATAGVAYDQSITAIFLSGPGSPAISLQTGQTMPPGLSFDAGRITGTPTTPGNYTINYNVSDGVLTLGRGINLTVRPLNISTLSQLPMGAQGAAYNQTVAVSGGNAPYSFQVTGGTLPGGLTLSAGGQLSGTPTSGGYWGFTITVTDSSLPPLTARKGFALGVTPTVLTLPSLSPVDFENATYTVGHSFQVGVYPSGGTPPYTWAITSGALPPGVDMLSPASLPAGIIPNGVFIGGTPTTVNDYQFTLQATDSSFPPQTSSRRYTLRVSPLYGENLPNGTYNTQYSARIPVFGGRLPYTFQRVEGFGFWPAANVTMSTSGDVTGTPAETGKFPVRLLVTDADNKILVRDPDFRVNPQAFSINTGQALGDPLVNQSYTKTFSAGTGVLPYSWTLEPGSTLPAGLTLSSNGALSGVPTVPGAYTFLIRVTDSATPAPNFAVRAFRLQATPIAFSGNAGLIYANVGTVYTTTLTVTGATGTVAWTVSPGSALPLGMTLSPTGVLSGSPVLPGAYSFSITAADSGTGRSNTRTYNISVYPPGGYPPLSITQGSTLGVFPRGPVKIQLNASGGAPPYTFSMSPAIANFRVQNGPQLPTNFPSGTPAGLLGVATEAGTYTTTLRVTDSQGHTSDKSVSFTISPLIVLNDNLPAGSVSESYSFTLRAAGGLQPSYSWSVTSGALPPGISLGPLGELSGVPTADGNFNFTITVVNGSDSLSFSLNLEVNLLRFENPDSILPYATVGSAYSHTLAVRGGTPPYKWEVQQYMNLPNPMTLNATTGVISGTPSGEFVNWFGIIVTDANGKRIWRNVALIARSVTPTTMRFTTSSDLGAFAFGYRMPDWPDDGVINVVGGYPRDPGAPPYLQPYNMEVVDGALPAGVSLRPGRNLTRNPFPQCWYLAGKPLELGTFNFTLKATDQYGTFITMAFTMRVVPVHIDIRNVPVNTGPPAVFGQSYTQSLLVIGGAPNYAWTALTTPPPGLSFSAAGVISGTPGYTGPTQFRAQVTDSANPVNTIAKQIQVMVSSGTPYTLGLSAGPDLGTFSAANTISRNFQGNTSPLINPGYTFTIDPSTPLPAGLQLLQGDALPPGANPGTATIGGILTTPGTYTFILRVTDANGNLGAQTYTLRVSPITFMMGNNGLPMGSTLAPYSAQLHMRGCNPSCTLTSANLPPGLTLSPAGLLSGTPASPGNYSFTVVATDSAYTNSRTYQIQIAPLNIATAGYLPTGMRNTPYSVTLAGAGTGTLTWSLGGNWLPAGLSLNATTGVISGTPTSSGSYSGMISIGNGSSTFSKRFAIDIRPNTDTAISITTAANLPDAVTGQVGNVTLGASGGIPPYAWTLTGGSLPAGWALISGAQLPANLTPGRTVLFGNPSQTGVQTFTLRATDSAGNYTEKTFRLTVAPIYIAQNGVRDTTQNATYRQVLTGMGAAGPFTFALGAGSLPNGLTMSSTGVIQGVPADTGRFYFDIRITGGGYTLQRSVSMLVASPTAITLDTGTPFTEDLSVGVGAANTLWVNGGYPSSGYPPFIWTLEPGSNPPPGFNLFSASGAQFLGGPPQALGTYTYTLRATDTQANFGKRTSSVLVSPMNISSPAVPMIARAGAVFSQAITVVNGREPYTFTLDPSSVLPPGITLGSTGIVAGTTTVPGSWSFKFTVRDANNYTLTRSLRIKVYPTAAVPLLLRQQDGYALPDASRTVNYSYELDQLISQGNPPYTWAVTAGSLPGGLTIQPGAPGESATLSGIPTVTGPYTFTLRATDGGAQMASIAVSVNVSAISLAPQTLPAAVAGTAYSQVLTAGGGAAPYSFSLNPFSSMPVGLTLGAGLLSGTPATVGTFSLYIDVADSTSPTRNTLTKWYTLTVYPPGTVIPSMAIAPAAVSLTYSLGSPAPAPIPIQVNSTSTALNYSATTTSTGGWLTVSPTHGSTPDTLNLVIAPAGLPAGVHTGVLTIASRAAANTPQSVTVTLTVSAPAPCAYAVSPSGATVSAEGGSGSLAVNTTAACNWAATASSGSPPWIALTGSGSGTGTGTVNYTVAANDTPNQRTGTISVGGQTYTVTQFGLNCAFTLSPTTQSTQAAGGSGMAALSASAGACAWTAASDAPWIAITPPTSGAGSANIAFTVASNGSPASRSGTLTIGGQILTVNQAGISCTTALTPVSTSMAYTGGSGSTVVATPAGCAWSVGSSPSWVTVMSGSSGSGGGTVDFTVAANSSTQARSGIMTIGGQPFEITQPGVPCSFSISGTNPVQPASGGGGAFNIAAAGPTCDWVAASNATWLTITSPPSGSGDGFISFSAASNTSPTSRSGTLTIAGQNVVVTQSGIVCSYSLRSPGADVSPTGGQNSIGVLAATGCLWNAAVASSSASWIHIASGTPGAGAGTVYYTVDPNSGNSDRSGAITIADQTFVVSQPAPPCTYTVDPASGSFGSSGSVGSFTFSGAGSGCNAAPVSTSSWITVASATGGSVIFNVAGNPSGTTRSGNIVLGDATYVVEQAGAACGFTLDSLGASFGRLGGNGNVTVTASPPAGCIPVVNSTPPLVRSGLTGGPAVYNQGYYVPAYESFINWVRTMAINFSGQDFTVKQSSW